jgi:hypothetical protein
MFAKKNPTASAVGVVRNRSHDVVSLNVNKKEFEEQASEV